MAEGASVFIKKKKQNCIKIRTSFPWEENRHVLTNQSTKNRIVQSLKSNILLLLVVGVVVVVWSKNKNLQQKEELVSYVSFGLILFHLSIRSCCFSVWEDGWSGVNHYRAYLYYYYLCTNGIYLCGGRLLNCNCNVIHLNEKRWNSFICCMLKHWTLM